MRYAADNITLGKVESVVCKQEIFSVSDLYGSNKAVMKMISDGFLLKREDCSEKDLYIQLIDYQGLTELREPKLTEVETIVAKEVGPYNANHNIYKVVNQFEILGCEKRIPDGIIYINGLPLVVFEFKSTICEPIFTTCNPNLIELRPESWGFPRNP